MMSTMMTDEIYMRRALRLAERGRGRTSPNPMVGAVVVKAGRMVGEGYHRQAGGPHAEVGALSVAGSRARGATLYVNLEPCCHLNKRTPPCTRAIIESGIRKVVMAMRDPNPQVNSRGLAALRRAGIQVAEGVLEGPARRLNEVYVKFITTGLPFVILKTAMTLDGKISTAKGSATWITGEKARRAAHRLRNQVDAVLVGIHTILTDDPRLTTRLPGIKGRDPDRVILDSTLRVPLTARVLTLKSDAKTIIATTRQADPKKIQVLEQAGATVCIVKDQNGRVSFSDLMIELGRMGIRSVLIEGGGEVNTSALSSGVVDKLVWFVAPKIIGRRDAVGVFEGPVNGWAPATPQETIPVHDLSISRIGEDYMITGYL